MQPNSQITFIVLTYNEQIHIQRCLESLIPYAKEIWVVDSFSRDHTLDIAQQMGAHTVQHPFENQAQQFNWALANLNIQGQWIWRVDADEYIAPELGQKVTEAIASCNPDVNGIYVNKAIVFQGRKLKHGGWYPAPQIKVIRRGYGQSENKVMDEHLIITQGTTLRIDADQTDENLNGLTWWTDKHNKYASREAVNMLLMQYEMDADAEGVKPKLFGNDAQRKRWFKLRYAKLPLYVRPVLYFLVRYVLKLGFLDRALTWYVLQSFWYRYLVDAKIYEIKRSLNFDEEKIKNHLKDNSLSV